MSYFTTKCDFYDDVESMPGGFNAWFELHNRNVEIEVDGKHFMVSCRDDVLPYYTRIVCVMCANKGHAYYKLSSIPYTQDMIEERKNGLRIWNKDSRNTLSLTVGKMRKYGFGDTIKNNKTIDFEPILWYNKYNKRRRRWRLQYF